MLFVTRMALLALALAAAACSDSSSSPTNPSNPPSPPVSTTTITITASGVSPRNIQVSLGARVRFINNDTRAHNMTSNPHPDHTDCPEINQVGFLQPGQQRETGNLVTVRTCGFHDHDNPTNASLNRSIVIVQ